MQDHADLSTIMQIMQNLAAPFSNMYDHAGSFQTIQDNYQIDYKYCRYYWKQTSLVNKLVKFTHLAKHCYTHVKFVNTNI